MKRVWPVLIGALLLLGAVALLWQGAVALTGALRSRDWPAVRGHIESSRVVTIVCYQRDCTMPDIHYTYQVNGQPYLATRISFTDVATTTSRAADTVAAFPAGANVDVYVDPSDASRSVLRRGVDDGILPFAAVGATAFALLLSPLARRLRERWLNGYRRRRLAAAQARPPTTDVDR